MWLKDANCFGERTWDDAISDCNGLSSGSCGLTDGSNAGDWRLPQIKELHSLIDYSNNNPPLTSGHPFSNVPPASYWSSTTHIDFPDYAWVVGMLGGIVLLNAARKHYDGDSEKNHQLGTFSVEMD